MMIKLVPEREDYGAVLAGDGRKGLAEPGARYSLPELFNAAASLSMVALCLKSETEASPTPDRNVASGR
jgi:hypothetical protein